MHSPEEILKKYWQYDSFRSPQREIIQSVLDQKDTLALLPTGAGKSLCFQVPGLCLEGITIVVSPLIALMRDQVMNLQKKGIKATAIVSGMRAREIDIALDNCVYGNIRFLYVSPERLKTEIFQERVKKMPVCLIAVDEAHCISQWGHDFRPSYLEIASLRALIPNVPVLAVTASATPAVLKEIQEKLAFSKHYSFFKTSLERKNIQYLVIDSERKQDSMLEIISTYQGTGIIYVQHRKKTEEISKFLNRNGYTATFYHAGLDVKTRSARQEDWIKNKIQIIVATSAFGMGIDKPDVRWVINESLPESLEAYYQESGRAGRDGLSSVAILLRHHEDQAIQKKNFEEQFPSKDDIRMIYKSIGTYLHLALGSGENQDFSFDVIDFSRHYGLQVRKVLHAIRFLEHLNLLTYLQDIHVPSKVKIELDAEQIYNLKIQFKEYDALLNVLMRNYSGILETFCTVNESFIAQSLSKKSTEIIQELHSLHKQKIIQYLPKKDDPVLFFNSERISEKNIRLGSEIYDFRKKDTWERLEAVWSYAFSKQCRIQNMLSYFHENISYCGICDICIKNNHTRKHQSIMENKLLEFVSTPRSLNDVLTQAHFTEKEWVLEAIQSLLDRQKIFIDQKGNYFT